MCTKQFKATISSFMIHSTGFRLLLQHCCHPPRHIPVSQNSDQLFFRHFKAKLHFTGTERSNIINH